MGWLGEIPILLFSGVRGPEIAVIVIVLLLIFGASRLPKIGSSLGRSLRAFKGAVSGQDEDEDEDEANEAKAGKGTAAVKNKE